MSLKLSKTAIRELTKLYRAVLIGAIFATATASTVAMADDVTAKAGTDFTTISSATGSEVIGTVNLSDYATKGYVEGYTAGGFVAKEAGKGLSTNDYTTAEKEKLADVYTKSEVYTKTETDTKLSAKANAADVYTKSEVYTQSETDTKLDAKADKATTLAGYGITDAYTKTETDTKLSAKANAADVYTKSEVYTQSETDTKLDAKADKATTLAGYGITDAYTKTETDTKLSAKANAADVYTKTEVYTKSETDTKLSAKADKATTLAGYGITDAYTKTETDTKLSAKANAADVYTKSEVYTKTETNSQITDAVAALDATVNKTAGADGLALQVTQVDGKITGITGSIKENTYDAYGSATTAETNAKSYADGLAKMAAGATSSATYNTGDSAKTAIAAVDVALKNAEDDIDAIETVNGTQSATMNTLAGIVNGGSVADDGTYTAGEALNTYDSKSTLTGVVNKLESNKQENLVIADDSGLQMDTDDKTLSVKLADNSGVEMSGLKLDDNGLSISTGDSVVVDKTSGKLDIKYDNTTFEATTDKGLKIRTGGITSTMIADGQVTTDDLASNAVTTAKIADTAVTEAKLATDAVTTNKIKDGNVTDAKLASGAVTTAKIADTAVTEAKLATDAVTTGKIKDGNVTEAKLASGAVTTAKIADTAVTEAKLATDAVTTGKIKDGSVTDAKLASNAVTTDKIKDANVTEAKLATDAVTTDKIKNAAVTDAKLATNAVTTDKIKDANVTEAKLATDAVTTDKIKNAAVTDAKLATNAVTTDKIKDGNVTLAKLGSDVATSTAESGSTKLMTSGGVYNITNVAENGNYITAGTNVAANLSALDTKVKANADTIGTANYGTDATKNILTNTTGSVYGDLAVLSSSAAGKTLANTFTKDNTFQAKVTVGTGSNLVELENGTIKASGLARLNGGINVNDSKFTVDENGAVVAANGNFEVTKEGNATVKGTLNVKDTATFEKQIDAQAGIKDGNTHLEEGTLHVQANTGLAYSNLTENGLTIDNGLADEENRKTVLSSTGVTTGDIVASGSATISGNETVGGNLTVGGATQLNDSLTVAKATQLNGSLTVADGKDTTLGGKLAVKGTTTLDGALNANGGISVDTDKFTVQDGTGNVATKGTLTADGATQLNDSLTVAKATQLNGSLTVADGKDTTLGGKLAVKGTTTLDGALNANGGISVDTDKFTVQDGTGNVATKGTLTADGLVTANNGLTVANNSDLTLGGTAVNAVNTGAAFADNTNDKTLATMTSVKKQAENATFTANNAKNVKTGTLNSAIATLDTEIGADSDYVFAKNGVNGAKTVKANIDAINSTIGDVTQLSAGKGSSGNAMTNGTGVAPTTVVSALNNIDATLGQIHGLKNGNSHLKAASNLAEGTTVEQHLVALDDAIGDRTSYTSTNYIANGQTVASSLNGLDAGLSGLETNVNKMEHEMKSGFASLAALSGLVPNARSAGDTQLSIGTGYYRGTTGFALGAFHHVNDNTLLNLGGAYAGNGAAAFRGGVTFGF